MKLTTHLGILPTSDPVFTRVENSFIFPLLLYSPSAVIAQKQSRCIGGKNGRSKFRILELAVPSYHVQWTRITNQLLGLPSQQIYIHFNKHHLQPW